MLGKNLTMNRREFFSLAACGAAMAPQLARGEGRSFEAAEPAEGDLCRYYAERLAEELERRHGVKWLIEVSHENMTVFGKAAAKPRAS